MDAAFSDFKLANLGQINVVLGKNGCGKSTLLRAMDADRRGKGFVKYVSPERGGVLILESGIENSVRRDPNWLGDRRRRNRADDFRQSSIAQFRNLEISVLRKIEHDEKLRLDLSHSFDSTVALINSVLDHVEVVRSGDGAFKVRNKAAPDQWRDAETLSSGESELVSLAIEILAFAYEAAAEHQKEDNWLLIDEPDVHLHPDLQYRLMRMLVQVSKDNPINMLIATHSTAILSALAENADVFVCFMGSQQKRLEFSRASTAIRAIVPVFGAHPLSNVYNEKPILLVEGEDDERIWQQAHRSSGGRIGIWPCAAGDIQSLNDYELAAQSIIAAVYEGAKAYSLRDRDDGPYEIEDLGPLVRTRLNCRSAENLLLSDDVLVSLGSNWENIRAQLAQWLEQHPTHPQRHAIAAFRDGGWDRRNANLKGLRVLIVALAGSTKPWEVAVGQAIAVLRQRGAPTGEHSLADYLGPKIVLALGLLAT